MKRLFAVVQMPQIGAWCWGSCGKGVSSTITLPGLVAAMPCAQEACPHRAAEDMGPVGTVPGGDGEEREVWVRELEELPEARRIER